MEHVGDEMTKVLNKNNWNERLDELVKEVLADPDVAAFISEHQDELTDEAIHKSYAKMYEYVQEKRKFKLNEPNMIAPGYEPKLFMNFHFIDVTYVPTEELLQKQAEQSLRNRVKAIGMQKDIREATLESYEPTVEREEALTAALEFIEEYPKNPKAFHKGLYLQGSYGVGKTYLLAVIANELAKQGIQSTLLNFSEFAVEMKRAIATNTTGDKVDAIKKSPVLMIDDIGADFMGSWIRDDILGVILQYRMQEQLPTFFSSNFSMEQLEKEHLMVTKEGNEEPMKAGRIMERIRYLAREIKMVGANRRNP
ncbi:primosomal protein DnaI [Vagococcus coleopterorum]|uniref:Primosomal protein DnaI n=1 Tax=Vagococcus coleopterorum TaxID=2714946 RepID=A0A6G8AN61_9ENTE|nr:primosomal protein DnaI [Vagococcus coleopterorum]QIL46436.1 primosomal protein DnaI [Vagococcus coleopterorum]